MKRNTLILIINISVLLLIVLVGLAAQVAPYFTCSMMGICTITFLYILTEQWMTHDASEFENRFWTFMAFVLASACLFCEDSPIQLADKPEIAWLVVFIFTFLAHNYDRHLQRNVLTRTTNMRRVRSQDFGVENRTNAQEKVVELRKLLSTIDHTWMSSTFLNFFFLYRVLTVEYKIITIMSEANSDELNLILNNIELALLFYKMKDHKIARRFNRSNLLKLLSVDRISELVIPSRVVLLDSLQRLKLSAHPQCEQYVKNIIFSTKTDDLSELKTLMDNKGDINNMHKLIYSDIRNPAIKDSILKYIAHQADIQKAHSTIGSKKGKQRGLLAWRKILSDVDDTLSCAGGSWPAGMDTSYPKKVVYPGVMAFYRELDLGTVGADEWDRTTRVGNLAFLSARPHVYKSVSENVSYTKFKTLQQERGLYTTPTLLAGSLDTGGQFMVKGDSEPLAVKKFENFREYLAIYPEYTCIFIGDNGQGDVRTAEMVLADTEFSKNLHRVYVHQVQPRHLTYCKNKEGTLRSSQLHFFGTYVAAALDAYEHKLIRASGLRNIMEEACRDFLHIPESAWLPPHSTSSKNTAATATPVGAAAGTVAQPSTPSRGRSPSVGGSETTLTYSVPSSPATSSTKAGAIAPSSTNFPFNAKTASSAPVAASRPPSRASVGKSLSRDGSIGAVSTVGSTSAASLTGGRESPSIPLLTRTFLGGKPTSMFNIKKLKTGALAGEGLTPASMGYCRGGGIVRTISTSAAEVLHAERKKELRMREINNDLERGNTLLCELGMPPVEYLAFPCRYSVGTSVTTIFGEGIITNFRPEDGIYEVLIGWEAQEEDPAEDLSAKRLSAASKGGTGSSVAAGAGSATAATGVEAVGGIALEESEGVDTTQPELLRRGSSASSLETSGRSLDRGVRVYIAGVAIHSQ